MRREPCLHPKWHKLEDSSSGDVGKGSRRIKYVQYDRVKIGVPLPSQNFGGHTAAIGLIAGRMATSPAIFEQNSPSGFCYERSFCHIYNI